VEKVKVSIEYCSLNYNKNFSQIASASLKLVAKDVAAWTTAIVHARRATRKIAAKRRRRSEEKF
jgi:hypothetical protein